MVDYFAAHHEADFVTKENGFVQDRDVQPDLTAAAEERTSMKPKADTEDDIAVVGMSCRFPGRAERMLLGAADERKHRHPVSPQRAGMQQRMQRIMRGGLMISTCLMRAFRHL